ncbi:MAG: SDR family oxidoreductase [Myxococcota bacterium]
MLNGAADRNGPPVAVVTGTSTGIGRSSVIHLARHGYQVVATMRDPTRARGLRGELARADVAADIIALDVDRDDSVARAFDEIATRYGRVDVLVNNAGISGVGTVEDTPMEAWQSLFETNLFGVVRCCQAVLPQMRRRGSGHIVNISSVTGRMATPGQAAYTASKFALEGFSETLANEVARFGIRVSIVEPGVTVTPIFGKHRGAPPNSDYGEVYRRMQALYAALMSRASRPQAVAEVVLNALTSETPRLRWPAGDDARALLAARHALSDDCWLELGRADQGSYRQLFARYFGVELALDEPGK